VQSPDRKAVVFDGSRDELVVEALATAFQDLDRWEEHTDTLTKLLENYLSEGHRDAPGTGCALGALLGDMSKSNLFARISDAGLRFIHCETNRRHCFPRPVQCLRCMSP
jgi:hypothetical protein